MSRWGSGFRLVAAAVITTLVPGGWAANWQWFASVAASERQRHKRDKANTRARQAFNESLKDRLEMVDLSADTPRTLCLGRVRYVEGVRDRWSSGTHSEILSMIVSFAGHEIDAIESWYVNDIPVTLDGSGYVQEAPYKATTGEPAQDSASADSGGTAVFGLSHVPVSGSLTANWTTGSGDFYQTGSASVSVVGTTATVTGAAGGATVYVNYQRTAAPSYLRIRPYLGTSTQNVGDDFDAEYPGKITSTDRFAGITLALVDLFYSPDVFPQGPPNITPVFRAAKCYDPRLDSTVVGGSGSHRIATPSTWAWSENPALHVLRYALSASGFALSYGRGITARTLADAIDAANQCDISTVFTLRKPDTTTTTVTLPRHRCGITIPADADPRSSMDAIIDTMAGEWAFDGPELRFRAGVKAASVASIDQTWLVEPYTPGPSEGEDPIVTATQSISRELRWNRITGKCVDPSQRYQMLPYPAVSDTTLIASKGEKRGELSFEGVTHVAHAQHLASIEIRRRQAGGIYVLQCDPRAEMLQLFDVQTFTLPDWGISAKPFEVVGVDISLRDAPVGLMLREISDAIFTVDAELRGVDPAPDSGLREPWDVAQLGALTVVSGTDALLDNSIVARALVTWSAVTGAWIRQGGQIEIQFTRADQALPAGGEWASWIEPGNSTQAQIPGLLTGRPYLFRGRMVQPLPLVRGAWSAVSFHIMATIASNPGTLGGRNLLRNSSFEVDFNVDGLPDNWTAYSNGTTGTITRSIEAGGNSGGLRMKIAATGIGTSSSDQIGVYQNINVAYLAGQRVTQSAWMFCDVLGAKINLYVAWRDSGGTVISSAQQVFEQPSAASIFLARRSQTIVVPAAAVTADVYMFASQRPTSAGALSFYCDEAQFEPGVNLTAHAPRADELLAGVVGTTTLAANATVSTTFRSGGGGTNTPVITGDLFTLNTGGNAITLATNTSGAAMTVQVEVLILGLYSADSTKAVYGAWGYKKAGASEVVTGLVGGGGTAPDYSVPTNLQQFGEFTLAPGESVDSISLYEQGTATFLGTWSAWFVRVSLLKR